VRFFDLTGAPSALSSTVGQQMCRANLLLQTLLPDTKYLTDVLGSKNQPARKRPHPQTQKETRLIRQW
jgi:hypothetical protein